MPLAACVLAVFLATASDAESAPRSLYEWLATAPVIMEAENLGTHGSYAEFRVGRRYGERICRKIRSASDTVAPIAIATGQSTNRP